jgi:hypothetical protein
MTQHAFCAPSDWEGWSNCPGKPALEENEPDVSSPDADFGTQAHDWAARVLTHQADLPEVPHDFVEGVTRYVDYVRSRVEGHKLAGAGRVTLLVEQKLDISVITGEKGAQGTSDAIILAEYEDYTVLDVVDLKFGIGVVVPVVDNGQLQIYGLAALVREQLLHNITEVNLIIHQPRVRKDAIEWRRTPDELYIFASTVTERATLSLSLRGDVAALSHLVPGEKQCRFCRARWRCPALERSVFREVYGEFQKIDDPRAVPVSAEDRAFNLSPDAKGKLLGAAMARVPVIEAWCRDVRAACDNAMLNEHIRVPGFKVVQGKKGNRTWTDRDDVFTELALFELGDTVITSKPELISPAAMQKALEDKHPDAWEAVQEYITQTEGKASVAPESDERPVYQAVSADEFESFNGDDLV